MFIWLMKREGLSRQKKLWGQRPRGKKHQVYGLRDLGTASVDREVGRNKEMVFLHDVFTLEFSMSSSANSISWPPPEARAFDRSYEGFGKGMAFCWGHYHAQTPS